ncbi:MAG: hypothetical protein JST46_03000 [Bacteroidetes bacterium]|nr:hypothetical protein [Bacteroidota bacterium]
MTADRKKAILFLSITFVLGLLIGALLPGFFWHMRHGAEGREGNRMERRGQRPENHKTRFEHMMFRVIKPDSAQAKELRQIFDETSGKIEVLQSGSNTRMTEIMDSMKMKVNPILTDEQKKRFEEFSARARERRLKNER